MTLAFNRRRELSRLSPAERELFETPWFHNFSPLGMATVQTNENAAVNQVEKQGPIFRLIRDAMTRCGPKPYGVDLFATDGMFGLYALTRGAGQMDILDAATHRGNYSPTSLEQTRLAAKLLHVEDRAHVGVVDPFNLPRQYEFGITAATLVHFRNPQELLASLRKQITKALVIQSPVSLRDESPECFQLDMKGREWGSRFSLDRLIIMAVEAGWTVVNEHRGELPAMPYLDDKGSAYLLCV